MQMAQTSPRCGPVNRKQWFEKREGEGEGGRERKACRMLLSNVKELIQLWDGHSHSLALFCFSIVGVSSRIAPLSLITRLSLCVCRHPCASYVCLGVCLLVRCPCTLSLPFSLPDLASFGSVCGSLNRRERDGFSLRCVRVMSLLDECVCVVVE